MTSHESRHVSEAFPPMRLVDFVDRDAFLEDLRASTNNPDTDTSFAQALLARTIHLLVTSRTVTAAFTPSMPHLRAYLASHRGVGQPVINVTDFQRPSSGVPLMAVFGLIELHRSTSEFSAQGLSRTLAAAVEAASAARMKLIIAEDPILSPGLNDEGKEMPIDGSVEDRWNEQVPVLNGSVRVAGDDRIWAGKTVKVGRILAKWCKIYKYQKLSNNDGEDANSQAEGSKIS
ncbi:MAG: hypothetical protein Q9214_002148 [Letrouitia sp. 1 TL-2023]